MQYDILLKLLAAHFLTDFILQPASWVLSRNQKHFKAPQLYVHGLVTTGAVILIAGLPLWWAGALIGLSHILFDGAKSYTKPTTSWFLLDQLLHLIIIALCWLFYTQPAFSFASFHRIYDNPVIWLYISAGLFLTTPSGFLIGLLTTRWRVQLSEMNAGTPSLEKAGMIIGIIERLLIFFLVIIGKFEAIGLLIAAKSLLRFNEKDRPEVKTEYLLVGTLISVALSVGIGFLVINIHF